MALFIIFSLLALVMAGIASFELIKRCFIHGDRTARIAIAISLTALWAILLWGIIGHAIKH